MKSSFLKIWFILIILFPKLSPNFDFLRQYCYDSTKYFSLNFNSFFNTLVVKNFFSFSELKINCIRKTNINIKTMEFVPIRPIYFDNSLDFRPFFTESAYLNLKFAFIKGFYSSVDIFNYSKVNQTNIHLSFSYSKLKFFDDLNFNKSTSIFNKIFQLYFYSNCDYRKDTNPLIFNNSDISQLIIYGLCDVFIKRNMLGFKSIEKPIFAKIESANFYFYRGYLDINLLNPKLFGNLKKIYIINYIEYISDGVFNKLICLEKISFEIRFIYSKEGIILFQNLSKILNLKKIRNVSIRLEYSDYFYPDEDFCYFFKFPKNGFLMIEIGLQVSNCTCLISWLINNFNEENINFEIKKQCEIDNINEKCNFLKFEQACDRYTFNHPKMKIIDILYETELLSFFTVILIPIISLLSIILNLLNLAILKNLRYSKKNKNKSENQNSIFLLMFSNSIFNVIYSIIYFFHIFNICVFQNGLFCLFISRSYFIQYYEIYVVEYFGNIIKTSSNIIALLVSFERYINYKSSGNSKIQQIINKKKRILTIILIIAIFINLDRIITSEINSNLFDQAYIYSYPEFPLKNTFRGIFDKKIAYQDGFSFLKIKNTLYFVIFLSNFLFNNIVLLLFLLIFDILLLIKFRKDITIKNRICKINLNHKSRENKIKNDCIVMKTTLAIIINSKILFICRVTEFILIFFVFKFNVEGKVCNEENKICTNLIHAGYFVYLLSSCLTFFIYFFLNSHFRKVIQKWFKKII